MKFFEEMKAEESCQTFEEVSPFCSLLTIEAYHNLRLLQSNAEQPLKSGSQDLLEIRHTGDSGLSYPGSLLQDILLEGQEYMRECKKFLQQTQQRAMHAKACQMHFAEQKAPAIHESIGTKGRILEDHPQRKHARRT